MLNGPTGNRTRISALQGQLLPVSNDQPVIGPPGLEPESSGYQPNVLPIELRSQKLES